MKPTSRSLLEAIQRFVESRKYFLPLSTKIRWRMHVNFLKEFPTGKSILDVHLMKTPVSNNSYG